MLFRMRPWVVPLPCHRQYVFLFFDDFCVLDFQRWAAGRESFLGWSLTVEMEKKGKKKERILGEGFISLL